MPFPTAGILDNFDRANDATPPPGANWSTVYNGHDIFSNTLRGHTAVDGNVSQWVGATYGPSIECYITSVGANAYATLYILDSTFDHGYAVWLENGVVIGIYREDTAGSDSTRLGAALSQAVDAGDAFGIYYNAATDTIYAYYKAGAGAWTEIANRTDSTYTDMDTLGFYSYGTDFTFDDFGGGTEAAGGRTTHNTDPYGLGVGAGISRVTKTMGAL